MSSSVAFRDVCYEINGKPVLSGLNLDVQPGHTVVLLGRSGSGKTTALKMVNGLLFPTAGEVLVEERSTRAWNLIELRRRIGYVIQEVGLFPHFTVAANVGLVPNLEGWDPRRISQRVNDLLERLGLPPGEFADRYPAELSGGQRQRVGVARALAADPPLLLFDEPFGALDPVTRQETRNEFAKLQRDLKKTAIFVTHDIHEAMELGDRIGLLHEGRLEILASPEQFLKADTEEARAFLACMDGRRHE